MIHSVIAKTFSTDRDCAMVARNRHQPLVRPAFNIISKKKEISHYEICAIRNLSEDCLFGWL